jgi:putative membrane protein
VTARWIAASLHLLALAIGLGSVWARGRAVRLLPDETAMRQAFLADTFWGMAAVLWISTGLWRLLGGLEKPTNYYLGNHVFLAKMALLAVVLALEILPVITLVRWRAAFAKGRPIDTRSAPLVARISFIQAGLVALMVFAATAMARGMGQ